MRRKPKNRRQSGLPPRAQVSRPPVQQPPRRRERQEIIGSREINRRGISEHVRRLFTQAEINLAELNFQGGMFMSSSLAVQETYQHMDSRLDDIERALDEINTAVQNIDESVEDRNLKIFNNCLNNPTGERFISRWITEKANKNKKDDVCNICLDVYKINDRTVSLPCGHDYHFSCLHEWFKKKPECPKCRKSFE